MSMRGASRALPAPRSGPGEPGNEPISTGRERFRIRRFAGLEGNLYRFERNWCNAQIFTFLLRPFFFS